jgi:fructose/tagatose bisphosphate aldolase
MAHRRGIAVEAELGHLKAEDEMSVEAQGALLIDPARREICWAHRLRQRP